MKADFSKEPSRLLSRALRHAASLWRRHRRRCFVVAAAAASAVACNLSVPWIVDGVVTDVGRAEALQSQVLRLALLALVLGVLYPAVSALRDVVWAAVCVDMVAETASEGFSKAQSLDASWHADHPSGRIVRDILRGASAVEDLSDRVLYAFFPALLLCLGTSAGIAWRAPILGAVFAATTSAAIAASMIHAVRVVLPRSAEASAADSEIAARLSDAVSCNAVVRAFDAERGEEEAVGRAFAAWRKTMLSAWTLGTANYSILHVSLGLLLVVSLAWMAFGGSGSSGDAAYVAASWIVLRGQTVNIGSEFRQAVKASGEMEALLLLLSQSPKVFDAPGAEPLPDAPPSIRFEGVSFGYPGKPLLFEDFHLEIRPGETVALVGRSGSGKTTLTRLLLRLEDPQAGRVLVCGADASKTTLSSLRRKIALVQQDAVLFHRTLRENVAYARPDALSEEVESASKEARVADFADLLPCGYDTLVGERGVKLSGGERQRVALARALLADRPILILDEATSALDTVSEVLVREALDAALVGRTAVVVAHRLSTVRRADRIVVLSHGKIVEQGTHAQLIAAEGAYAAMCRADSGVLDGGVADGDGVLDGDGGGGGGGGGEGP